MRGVWATPWCRWGAPRGLSIWCPLAGPAWSRRRPQNARMQSRHTAARARAASGLPVGTHNRITRPCSPRRFDRRTASSISPAFRRRTSLPRCVSSAAFTGRVSRSRRRCISQSDEIAQFIARIEHTDAAFQRLLSRAKVRALKNFYEMAVSQPPIPGTVLLFTSEKLEFKALAAEQSVGHLQDPNAKFLIIDGQHRLAALQFYLRERPGEGNNIHVPVRDLRRPQRGLRRGDVRHHQLHADAHQQEPPRRPLRAGVLGRARQAFRGASWWRSSTARATARCATASTASAAAASRKSGYCRRSCSTSCTAG